MPTSTTRTLLAADDNPEIVGLGLGATQLESAFLTVTHHIGQALQAGWTLTRR